MRVRLLATAEHEMRDAAEYYESQAAGLGVAFLDILEAAFMDIGDRPDRWPVVSEMIRRRLVRRFPYAVFYRVDPAEVVVLAVGHVRRRPGFWSDR